MLAAALLHLGDGRVGGAASGKHGIDDQDVALGDILWHFAEIDVRDQRLLVAEHANMTDTGGGDHAQDTVNETETGAEDGNDCEFLTGQRRRVHFADRRFDMLGGHGQVAGRLIGDEHTDLADELAKILDAGVLVPHDGQLVCNQRMIHDVYLRPKILLVHPSILLFRPIILLCLLPALRVLPEKGGYNSASARPRRRPRRTVSAPTPPAQRRTPAAGADAQASGKAAGPYPKE